MTTTKEKVFQALEKAQADWRRVHLGGSLIGHPCQRHVWYSFRWMANPRHPGQRLSLFARGHREEPIQWARLRGAGIQVWRTRPGTSERILTGFQSPHLGGEVDAIVLGLVEDPENPYILDCKLVRGTEFRKAVKDTAAWGERYIAQQDFYLSDQSLNVRKAGLWIVNKEDDAIHLHRWDYDKDRSAGLVARAETIATAEKPLPKISTRADFWVCKNLCHFKAICHEGQQVKEKNCRTCQHGKPVDNRADVPRGHTFGCELKDLLLSTKAQKAGCEKWESMEQ